MIECRHGGFSSNNQFVYYDRSRLSYDLTVNSNQLILPPSLMGQFNNKLTEGKGDTRYTNLWIQTSKALYYYSNISITSIEPSKQVKVKIFPNPTQDYIQIRTTNLQEFSKLTYRIFNINGQNLLSGEDIHQPIDIRNLNPGLYLLKIIDENKTIISKRFVVSF